MPRYKITIEYDGTPFVGWQIQKNGVSIQGRLAEAIKSFSGETMIPTAAGRTDAGVHALDQVAHIDLTKKWATDQVRDAINYYLKPDPIAVLRCENVRDDFNARFDAKARHYLYRIVVRRAPLTLDRTRIWRVPKPLDISILNEAAHHLVGTHDFTTFRSVLCQAKSPVKSIDEILIKEESGEINILISARSFMHHQVRSMVGSLKLVGEGRWTVSDFVAALEAKDRKACGPVAPAHGLYLCRIDY